MRSAFLVFLAGSYLLGAIPTSYLVGRAAKGLDLREHGSGNLGAANVYRVLGWRLAIPVFALDMAKGWAPAYLFPGWSGQPGPEWGLAFGAAAVVGHVFSIFVRFRGGKGVATGAGVFLAVAPAAVLVALLVWGAVLAATRIVSAASIVAAAVLPAVVLIRQGPGLVFWASAALATFVIVAHRSNIARLLRGQERRIGRRGGEIR